MVDNFDVLKKMADENSQGIKAYTGGNFMEAKTGKDGWGFVKMAVDNKTIAEMAAGKNLAVILMIYDRDEFSKVKAEMEPK